MRESQGRQPGAPQSKFKLLMSLLLSLILWGGASCPVSAQLSSDYLQELCAPIALYPDPLLSNVLAASTYPDEVAAAARWRQRVGPIAPSAIDSTLAGQGWDPAVKSLVAFPGVLNYMANNMAWTVALGNAFLAQGPDVFEAIQSLRLQAQSSGNLGSTNQQMVSDQGGAIIIEPTNPNMIYVPSYDPGVVYYQPVSSGLSFGLGIIINQFLWMGVPDWNQDRLYFGRGYNNYYRGRGDGNNNYYRNVRNNVRNNQGAWRFNGQHRGGRAVPTAAQLQPGRGYNNYQQSPQSGVRNQRPGANYQQPAINNQQPGVRNQRPGVNNQQPGVRNQRPGANNPQPTINHQRPAYQPSTNPHPIQPQVRTTPSRPTPALKVPSGFNVRPGPSVNQESTRGAQSRNQPRPTQVAPIAPRAQSRPAQSPSRVTQPPSRTQGPAQSPSRPSPGGNRGEKR